MSKKKSKAKSKSKPKAKVRAAVTEPVAAVKTMEAPVEVKEKPVVPTGSEDGVLKVVSVKKLTEFELRVIIEGTDLERLTTPEARKLAFEQRLNHGMADAGVEALAGTIVPTEEYAAAEAEGRDVARWHREFRMVNML